MLGGGIGSETKLMLLRFKVYGVVLIFFILFIYSNYMQPKFAKFANLIMSQLWGCCAVMHIILMFE